MSNEKHSSDRWLETFTSSRDAAVETVMNGLSDLLTIMDATMIQEKYGISVMFDQSKIHWEARDPQGYFIAIGNTPSAAIFLWDHERSKVKGDSV